MNGLGSIIVFLKADASIYNRVLDHAARTMDRTAAGISGRVGRMITDISQRMTALGRVLTYTLASALIAFGAMGTKAFSEFDDAINRTVSISGEASDKIRRHLEVNAIAISKTGRQSAIDLANGYYYLVAAGLSAKESLEALATVEQFATAGAFNLEDASSLLVDTQNVLGLRTKDTTQNLLNMTKVADVIAKAGNITNASTEQFARALVTKSGAALRLLGKDMEEGVAVLAALAQQGTKAELAGEQLYIFLRDAQAAAQKNSEAWVKLGMSVYDVEGNMRHVADIIEQLEMLLNGASDSQVKLTMKMLGFTDRSVGATYSLLGLSSAIRDYEKQLRSAGGDNARMAAKRMESFAAAIIRVKNIIVSVAIDMARVRAPGITAIANKLAEMMQWWDQLNDKGKSVVTVIMAVAAAIGPVLLIIGSLGMSLGIVITGFSTLIATFGPAIAVLVALTGGVASVVHAFQGREGVIAAFDAGTKAIKRYVFMGIGFLANFNENAGPLFAWLRDSAIGVWDDIQMAYKMILDKMGHNTQVGIEGIVRMWGATYGWFKAHFMTVFSVLITNALSAGVVKGMEIYNAFLNWVIAKTASAGRDTPEVFAAGAALGTLLAQGAAEGVRSENLPETLQKILGETLARMENPLEFFSSSMPEMPAFNYNMLMEKLDALADEFANVQNVAKELNDEIEQPHVYSIKVEGIDGIRKGSQEAELLFRKFEAGRKKMDENPVNIAHRPFIAGAAGQEEVINGLNARGAMDFQVGPNDPIPDFNLDEAVNGMPAIPEFRGPDMFNGAPDDIMADPMDLLEQALQNAPKPPEAFMFGGADNFDADAAFMDFLVAGGERNNELFGDEDPDGFLQFLADGAKKVPKAAPPKPAPKAVVPAQQRKPAWWQEGGSLDKMGAAVASAFLLGPLAMKQNTNNVDPFKDNRPIVVVEPANLE